MTDELPTYDNATKKALQDDPSTVKLPGAIVELRYAPQFLFFDKRGYLVEKLAEQFPKDTDTGELEYEFTDDQFVVKKVAALTQSFIGVTRSGFSREMMVPTTLSHFFKYGREHIELCRKELPKVKTLHRIGCRVQQLSQIPEIDVKRYKTNFIERFLSIETFFQKMKSPETRFKADDMIVVFNLKETSSRSGKVFDYGIRLAVGVGTGSQANSVFKMKFSKINEEADCLFTDMDFFILENGDFDDAIRLTRRAEERALEIHSLILEAVSNA